MGYSFKRKRYCFQWLYTLFKTSQNFLRNAGSDNMTTLPQILQQENVTCYQYDSFSNMFTRYTSENRFHFTNGMERHPMPSRTTLFCY